MSLRGANPRGAELLAEDTNGVKEAEHKYNYYTKQDLLMTGRCQGEHHNVDIAWNYVT